MAKFYYQSGPAFDWRKYVFGEEGEPVAAGLTRTREDKIRIGAKAINIAAFPEAEVIEYLLHAN